MTQFEVEKNRPLKLFQSKLLVVIVIKWLNSHLIIPFLNKTVN